MQNYKVRTSKETAQRSFKSIILSSNAGHCQEEKHKVLFDELKILIKRR